MCRWDGWMDTFSKSEKSMTICLILHKLLLFVFLSSAKCNKRLDSTNYNQNNDDVLCTACYRKTCGPRVYGFVSGSVLPTTLDIEQADQATPSASSSSCSSPSLESCPPQHARTSSVSSINRDDPQCCPSCGKRVYFAEEVKVQKRKWHRLCFKCRKSHTFDAIFC